MKIAIIGSRTIHKIDLSKYLPPDTTEIISGGAVGVDTIAAEYARVHAIPLTELLPNYTLYGRVAPLVRNKEIVRRCELLLAFWDGHSRGTVFTINYAKSLNRPIRIYRLNSR